VIQFTVHAAPHELISLCALYLGC